MKNRENVFSSLNVEGWEIVEKIWKFSKGTSTLKTNESKVENNKRQAVDLEIAESLGKTGKSRRYYDQLVYIIFVRGMKAVAGI